MTKFDQLHLNIIEELEKVGSKISEQTIKQVAKTLDPKIKKDEIDNIINRMLHFGAITDLLNDGDVTEVMVNGHSNVFYEKSGKLFKADKIFDSEQELLYVINRMVSYAGRRIDISSPMVDARLADGSRINAVIPPLARNGATLTIRKFSRKFRSLSDLRVLGAFDEKVEQYLHQAILDKRNIIISGGTGSGKTTMLNSLASIIPLDERIVTIEDSAELIITHPNSVSLEARLANLEGRGEVTIRMLVKNALRMRPDRIIVGEVRGGEAADMLTAMNTGHEGSLTTMHANSPFEGCLRLETMCLMSDLGLPLAAIRRQIIQSLDVIVQIKRKSDGRRGVSDIVEIDKNSEDYKLKNIWSNG